MLGDAPQAARGGVLGADVGIYPRDRQRGSVFLRQRLRTDHDSGMWPVVLSMLVSTVLVIPAIYVVLRDADQVLPPVHEKSRADL